MEGKLQQATCNLEHFLQTSGLPFTTYVRCLYPEKMAATQQKFMAREREGVVPRSSSPWASPLHMVRKADGS